MGGEALVRFEHLQQFAGLPLAFVSGIVRRSAQTKREGQVNNGVNLVWHALINVEG